MKKLTLIVATLFTLNVSAQIHRVDWRENPQLDSSTWSEPAKINPKLIGFEMVESVGPGLALNKGYNTICGEVTEHTNGFTPIGHTLDIDFNNPETTLKPVDFGHGEIFKLISINETATSKLEGFSGHACLLIWKYLINNNNGWVDIGVINVTSKEI